MKPHTQSFGAFVFHTCLFFSLFLSISSDLLAQSYQAGYIINRSGDRIDGYILFQDHPFNRQKCRFKSTEKGKAQNFAPSEIQAYEITGVAAYRSAANTSVSSEEVFLEYVLKGTPSLLYYGSSYFVESEGELEELTNSTETIKRDGKVFERETETFKRQLLDYFKSCPDLSTEILASGLNSKSLYKVFTAYYACVDIPFQSFISKGNLIQVTWGLGVKVQRGALYAERLAGSTYYFETADPLWKPFYSPFIAFQISYPRINSQLSLRGSVAYHQYAYSYAEINDRAGVDLFYEMNIKASQIEIPIEVLYKLNKNSDRAVSPYVFAGGGINFLLNLEGERKTTTLTDISLSRNTFSGRSSSFMIRGGVGASLALGKAFSLSTELFVENSNGFIMPDDNDVVFYRKALGLSVGVYF